MILLYVDDLLLVDTSSPKSEGQGEGLEITEARNALKAKYRMTDLGEAERFLGLRITRSETNPVGSTFRVSQEDYVDTLMQRFGQENARGNLTPMALTVNMDTGDVEDREADRMRFLSIVGSLMFAAIATRPDISYAVASLSRHNSRPLTMHMNAALRTLRYLKQTRDLGLVYEGRPSATINQYLGFSDADWAGSIVDRKSISGHVFFGTTGGAVSWSSRRQDVVAQSTLEAEYIAVNDAMREALNLRKLCTDLSLPCITQPVRIRCDNQGALALAETGVIRRRTKHIDVKYHRVQGEIKIGTIEVEFVASGDNVADVLTKALPTIKHERMVELLRLR